MDLNVGDKIEIIVCRSETGGADVVHSGELVMDQAALCIRFHHQNCEIENTLRNYSWRCEFNILSRKVCDNSDQIELF